MTGLRRELPDLRPDRGVLRRLVIDGLRGTFEVRDVDAAGFVLQRGEAITPVHLTAAQLGHYLATIEDSAFDALGLEPRWRSSVSLATVHIMEEAAMATPAMAVILDGTEIRRDPPPSSS